MENSEVCQWCAMPLFAEGSYEIEEEGWFCHNPDWVVQGGTCWEQKVCEDEEEMEEWLEYGFECDGCEPDSEGECTCLSN